MNRIIYQKSKIPIRTNLLFQKLSIISKQIPQWLFSGITFLLRKADETNNSKNYGPVTCLTTMCKILTSILTEYTYSFLSDIGLFPDEQKGFKSRSGCYKYQLLINKMILENFHYRNINLPIAWVDYKRHLIVCLIHGWENVLKTFKISPVLRNFLTACVCGKQQQF